MNVYIEWALTSTLIFRIGVVQLILLTAVFSRQRSRRRAAVIVVRALKSNLAGKRNATDEPIVQPEVGRGQNSQ